MLGLVFPDECRVCDAPLTGISRIPVCPSCLQQPVSYAPEFFCAACRTPFLNAYPLDERGICRLCRLETSGYDAAYSFGLYEGPLRQMIQLFKYSGIETLAKPLGEMLARALPRDERVDVIVPMPLHWRRRWQRGYNQAGLLARVLGRQTGLPVQSLLRRTQSTRAQAGLSRRERRANVAAVFAVPRSAAVSGKHVVLVDDVLTTGATAAACARALRQAGAARVLVLTVARADRRRERVEVRQPGPAAQQWESAKASLDDW